MLLSLYRRSSACGSLFPPQRERKGEERSLRHVTDVQPTGSYARAIRQTLGQCFFQLSALCEINSYGHWSGNRVSILWKPEWHTAREKAIVFNQRSKRETIVYIYGCWARFRCPSLMIHCFYSELTNNSADINWMIIWLLFLNRIQFSNSGGWWQGFKHFFAVYPRTAKWFENKWRAHKLSFNFIATRKHIWRAFFESRKPKLFPFCEHTPCRRLRREQIGCQQRT